MHRQILQTTFLCTYYKPKVYQSSRKEIESANYRGRECKYVDGGRYGNKVVVRVCVCVDNRTNGFGVRSGTVNNAKGGEWRECEG
jgi:hypothetical protein